MADTTTQPARRIVTKRPTDRQEKATTVAAPAPAPTSRIIDIEDESEPITVNLIGQQYIAYRPKSMLAIRLGERINASPLDTTNLSMLVEAMKEFMVLMFGTVNADLIMERLEDPDDRLDLPHLQRLVNRMVEVTTGRPPTSSPASATP